MDIMLDEDYLKKLSDLQSKINPKPYSEEERKQIIEQKLQERNDKCSGHIPEMMKIAL